MSRLIAEAVRLSFRRLSNFRVSLAFEVIASLAFSGITIIFWNVVYGRVRPLPGWTLGQVFALTALAELFYALTMSLFISTGKLWLPIVTGRIDIYLVRPVDPRLLMIILSFRPENLIRAIPSIGLLVGLAVLDGVRFTLLSVLGTLLLVLLGATTYACLQMAGSWASFWLGRTKTLDELTDSFTEFSRYPTTVFPGWLRLTLTTVVPMALAATEPALFLTGLQADRLGIIVATFAVTFAWWLGQDLIWRKGLARYDSYGG